MVNNSSLWEVDSPGPPPSKQREKRRRVKKEPETLPKKRKLVRQPREKPQKRRKDSNDELLKPDEFLTFMNNMPKVPPRPPSVMKSLMKTKTDNKDK